VQGVASHPEDDLILATAVSAQADYLVTGDRQLLALGEYQGAQIVTPRAFATILGPPTSVQ
jgi:predicted nucleic acid-binding protein